MSDILFTIKMLNLKRAQRVYQSEVSNYNESINNVFSFLKNWKMKTFKMIVVVNYFEISFIDKIFLKDFVLSNSL